MSQSEWYVIYTRPNAEKKFAARLTERGIESYLPLSAEVKIWSDRKKTIHEPLFKSYVFARCTIEQLHIVKTVFGFSNFISFGGYPTTIKDRQIEIIKSILRLYADAKSISTRFVMGDEVTIISGPLKGLKGVLASISGKKKVAIKLSHLEQSLLLHLPEAYLMKTANENGEKE